jgi:hypothetical protein
MVFARQKLSAREQDVFALLLCHMKVADWGTEDNPAIPTYSIPAPAICKMLTLESANLANTISGPCKKLAGRTIGIYDDNKHSFIYRSLFKEISYKSGILTMKPNEQLKAEFIGGVKGYALVNREAFYSLKREPSKRLYDLLSRWKDRSKGKINKMRLEDLKGIFGVLDESGNYRDKCQSFENNSVFITRYVDESINEIQINQETKSQLAFHLSDCKKPRLGYKLYKTGLKFTHIEFLYSWVNDNEQPINQLNFEDAFAAINEIESYRKHMQARGKKLPTDKLQLLYDSYQIAILAASVDQQELLITRANRIKASLEQRQRDEEIKCESEASLVQNKVLQLSQFILDADDETDF